jgi:hypothetical protein
MMCAIPFIKSNDDALALLREAQGLVEVLGYTLSGNMPIEGRIRDGLPIVLDTLAVTLAKAEQRMME